MSDLPTDANVAEFPVDTTTEATQSADKWFDSSAGGNPDGQSPPSRLTRALADFVEACSLFWFWTRLAHQDMRMRYRGSVIGPFWQTLTTGIMIGSMGVIYAKLFHTEMKEYLPMLACGLISWQLVAGLITESCGAFDAVRGIIQQVRLPFFLHAFRLVYRNILLFLHSFVIIPIVLFIFPHPIEPMRLVELIPAMVLIAVNGVATSIILGMICARFRDVPLIVANIVQVTFFLTPIVFTPSALGDKVWLAYGNPLFAAVDVMRAPLLGQPTAPYSWAMLLFTTVLSSGISFLFFVRFRGRIAYWV
ncbi:MAG TPA: ABC transporter permease [Stellaceae bacterium]|nr:ABC transporter permease [Stellaceae bacterium]